jgi:hypothetical protein
VDQGTGELLVAPRAQLRLLDPAVLIQHLLLTLAALAPEEGSPAGEEGVEAPAGMNMVATSLKHHDLQDEGTLQSSLRSTPVHTCNHASGAPFPPQLHT